MFGWLFPSQKVQVELIPSDKNAMNLPGFHSGKLECTVNSGETVANLLDKLNTYRGPDTQIKDVYTSSGDLVPKHTKITGRIQLYVRAEAAV
jgi:hypothetical protein